MLIENLIISNNKMQMNVTINETWIPGVISSEEFVINGIVKFQLRIIKSKRHQYYLLFVWILVKLVKLTPDLSIHTKFSSNLLNIQNMYVRADSQWHLLPTKSVYVFDISFTVKIKDNFNSKLKALYDEEPKDFELRGDDGSVGVHKCMLAVSSPVFKAMLQGDWEETRNGYIHLKGTSKAILQEFKEYIYLNRLPATVSKETLLIAMQYDIPQMEIICIKHMIQNIKGKNVHELLEFAVVNKIYRLTEAILKSIQNGVVNVNEVKKGRPTETPC